MVLANGWGCYILRMVALFGVIRKERGVHVIIIAREARRNI